MAATHTGGTTATRRRLDQPGVRRYGISGPRGIRRGALDDRGRQFAALGRADISGGGQEGYRTGPVSLLTLDGVAPALVFQKQNNTFAKRHHIRIWRTARSIEGQAVWVAAATHDTGIEFAEAQKRFTHRSEGDIDLERATVLADLTLAGAVPEFAMIERATVARACVNAAGDAVATDGRLALLFLRHLEPREAIR